MLLSVLDRYYEPGFGRWLGRCGICRRVYRDRYTHLLNEHGWCPAGTWTTKGGREPDGSLGDDRRG